MSVNLESAARLNALKQGIEATTGESYPDLTGGVNALIAGFGQGGDGGNDVARSIVNRTIEEFSDNEITRIEQYAFYDCQKLVTVDCPNLVYIGGSAFYSCLSLRSINFPNVTSIGVYSFRATRLQKAIFPKLANFGAQAFRYNNSKVEILDLPICTAFGVANFERADTNYCSHLMLRANSVCVLQGNNDGIKNVYVPGALIDEYKMATNWSALYASNPDIFHALEDYTVDGTVGGDLDESKVLGGVG